jgi:hypothetical protein
MRTERPGSRWCRLCCALALALLKVTPAAFGQTNCATVPTGLISWWKGDGGTFDYVGGNSGTLAGNASFGPGLVGQAFVFDGIGDGVTIGNSASLQLQTFTIESWVKRASLSVASHGGEQSGAIFAGTFGGYALALFDDGRPLLGKVGVSYVSPSFAITDTNTFHHLAVTKSGTNVVFYLDGAAQTATPYDPGFEFNGAFAIGARGGDLGSSFLGSIDEVSVYNRALAAPELQAIYNAGSLGKCFTPTPPLITVQPTDQTVPLGGNVTFTVAASGTQPLSYQWLNDGTNISGATSASLMFANVQLTQAGSYSVVITNFAGTTNSSSAILVVSTNISCAPVPSGLVGWWRGEGNTLQSFGTNTGTLIGNTHFGPGEVGQAFVFDGSGDGVQIGDPAQLHLQNFTIEAWIKRASTTVASLDPLQSGEIFVYSWGGYALALWDDGRPLLGKVGYSYVSPSFAITDTNTFHHVAVTKSGTNVIFYLDGVSQVVGPYNTLFEFNGPVAIGARGGDIAASFLGSIDEVSIYNRDLSAAEIQSIYIAGSYGKCTAPVAPTVVTQPTNQTVFVGATVTFTTIVSGSPPFSYQWMSNGIAITGATTSSLVLTNVQFAQAGSYSFSVSNAAGVAISSNATLSVVSNPSCAAIPLGLVSWWRGEGNALDQAGTNNGALIGNTTIGPGKVGQSFVFDGSGDGVRVGDSANFHLQNFTIEAWVKRASTSVASLDPYQTGGIFVYSWGGYALALWDDGRPLLGKVGYDNISPTFAITDTNNFHHVAVAKNGTNVVFYLDGIGQSVGPYNTLYEFGGPAGIGARGDDMVASFLGSIDEVAIYNRPLSAGEIQAIYTAGASGKCITPTPPFITVQPTNQTAPFGGSVTFTIAASGTQPLSYQWLNNGTNIPGATFASLTLTNLQPSQSGIYSVAVTNIVGSTSSSNALLTVNPPPAAVRISSAVGNGGGAITIPVTMVANGNENSLGFSLNWNPALLEYATLQVGSGAPGAQLLVNTNQAANGKAGFALALPTATTFVAGTQEVVRVIFNAVIVTNNVTNAISFGDTPINRQLSDALSNPLPATFTSGIFSVVAVDYEGDVSPRPNGDKGIGVTDWVLIGRYAARLDNPTNGSEFQRADCAPRSTLGDGLITVTDWVQAGRYVAKLDPQTMAGGPTSPAAGSSAGRNPLDLNSRKVKVENQTMIQSQPGTLIVNLEAQGNENALGFSLAFDPVAFSYLGASLGTSASGASLIINSDQSAVGRIGFVLALEPGKIFAGGNSEIVRMTLKPSPNAAASYPVSLTDLPVPREISDATASSLNSSYINGLIEVNPLPYLSISNTVQTVTLNWPLWASNFILQEATALDSGWTNHTQLPQTNASQNTITIPIDPGAKFYRLRLP